MTATKLIVMTLMVRDEVDIIAAMIEHHLAQGIDLIIATDNGSIDGTREVLADYAELGVVELHDDPTHRKQQAEVVTRMARRAYEVHGARWVINADADEFWFATGSGTIADALLAVPADVQSFDAPVWNLFGRPLAEGSAALSHVWRDVRDDESLNAVGLHAHPTPDRVHRGDGEVEVVQGNHATSLPLTETESIPSEARLEVLHLPYRTWSKYRHRVSTTAAAYAASGLTPSPRHHGIRDSRWLERGALLPVFVARHPDEAGDPSAQGFERDDRLRNELTGLLETGARLRERLAEALATPVPLDDEAVLRERFAAVGPWMIEAAEQRARCEYREQEFYTELMRREGLEQHQKGLETRITELETALETSRRQTAASNATVDELNSYLARLLANPVVRSVARAVAPRYGWGERTRKLRALVGRTLSAVRHRGRRS